MGWYARGLAPALRITSQKFCFFLMLIVGRRIYVKVIVHITSGAVYAPLPFGSENCDADKLYLSKSFYFTMALNP